MEEISSLDSFHTEPETIGDGGHVGAPKNSDTAKLVADVTSQPSEVDRLFDMPGTPVVDEARDEEIAEPTKENIASTLADTAAINDEDEFDQISDGTFEVDENSRAASAGPSAAAADEDAKSQEKQSRDDQNVETNADTALAEIECNEQEKKEEDNVENVSAEEKSSIFPEETENKDEQHSEEVKKDELAVISSTQESADFEEVDANVSASAVGCEESDMLGESDMTLPTTNALSEKDESPQAMEVDNYNEDDALKSADEAERSVEKEKTVELPADVEMGSPDVEADSAETSNVKSPEQIKENESMEEDLEKDKSNKETTNVTTEEKDEVCVSNSAIETTTEETTTEETTTTPQAEEKVDNSKESEIELISKETSTPQHDEADKEDTPTDAVDADLHEETETRVVEAADEEEPEQDDEPVENVQEPEESDVCLIPDDTETEMTDAEKEQAILARENAEKEDEQAEQESETAKEQNLEAEKSQDISANAEAQATEAGAEATAKEGNEVSSVAPGAVDVPDTTDEPLLEEMQSGGPTGDTGSSSKIIIAWIVATQRTCKLCGLKKLCGFRYKNPETSEPEFLCEQSCCDALLGANQGKYFIRRKKFLVEEISNDVAADDHPAGNDVQRNAAGDRTYNCLQCKESKPCKYFFKQDDETYYICNDDCFNLLSAEEPEKFKLKRHSIRVRNIGATTLVSSTDTNTKKTQPPESRVVARTAAEAEAARLERVTSFTRRCADCFSEVTLGDKNLLWETMDFCNEICLGKYQRTIGASCQTCRGDVPHQALGKYCVRFGFEIRQFCCAACLNEFKKGLKTCSCCQKDISSGNEGFLAPVGDKEQFKDFCSQACMRRYDAMCNPKKKMRNDVCAVCNNDKPVRVEIMLDDKEHNFCSNPCFSAFKFVSNIVADQCGMCCKYFERKGSESFTIYTERRAKVFCSRICLNVYIIVNRKIVSCQWCKVKKYNFDMIYKQQDSQEILMCSLNCLTLYGVSINAFSRTVAKCDNCTNSATPQYHLTMSDASMRNFCTYQCVMQFQSQFARAPLTLDSSNEATPVGQQQAQPQPAGAANTNKSTAPFPTGLPKRVKLRGNQQQPTIQIKLPTKNNAAAKKGPQVPVISTVSSLASGETETMIGNVTVRRSRGRGRKIESPPPLAPPPVAVPTPATTTTTTTSSGRGRPRRNVDYTHSPSPVSLSPPRTSSKRNAAAAAAAVAAASTLAAATVAPPAPAPQIQIQEKITVQTETKIVTVPPYPPAVRNVQTSCKPQTVTVGFQCEPTTRTTSTQTSKDYSTKVLIPVPVPIYIPQPMYMYSAPFPVPVPIPLPIPVPIFIPTSRNSAQGILKEIKKIQDKMPADPFEAELLMMAEMVAEEKRDSDSDSEDEIKPDPGVVSLQYDNNVQQVEVANNSYGEDVLQMALKMATGEYDQPTVDLESAMTANTITNPPPGMVGHDDSMSHMSSHHMQQQHMLEAQRGGRGRKRGAITTPVAPRNNRSPVKRQRLQELDSSPQPPQQNMQPVEKPDANMCLKYTFGVNAWKQWVMTKNADLEKSSIRRRPFKTELLQMTADELNYSLCLFVKEVRKPNGTEYAPDTIYYLVLGIQQYLYENGRIDNIFTDPYYERFTDCLDEVARKFSVLYNDSQYIVTRVEEEHLWECKQLGAHSPHVLLSTLMFFNTKHFNLTTVEEHMQLSFSHIMKHWKRSAQNAKSPGTRNVLLRFYPPQAGLDANPRKKKVYEQQENEENPLRCPVRLYEFYLSKCPESVKTRNDVFYLQPERSCVPDSPVWYSTQALSQESLQKMLHRVKMVKEINIALLTS